MLASRAWTCNSCCACARRTRGGSTPAASTWSSSPTSAGFLRCGVSAEGGWPELLVAPPDRAQTIHPGPLPGSSSSAPTSAATSTPSCCTSDAPGDAWQALTDDPEHIHNFGSFSPDGASISFAANTRTGRWFDVYVRDLDFGRDAAASSSTTRPIGRAPFSPDGALADRRSARSRTRAHELWLVDLRGGTAAALADRRRRRGQSTSAPTGAPTVASSTVLTDRGRELSAPARLDVATGELTYLCRARARRRRGRTSILPARGWRTRSIATARRRSSSATLAPAPRSASRGLPPGALYTYWQSALAWDPPGSSWPSRGRPRAPARTCSSGRARGRRARR